jgi:chromate reductase
MSDLHLLGLCGSLRAGSTNRLLLREAARVFQPARFTEANLRLPLYDGDLEAEGMPPDVTALAEMIRAADAVVIATPEYNKNMSGVLKNALDWISRTKGAPLRDKPVAILSAAAGRAGGERAQFSLRLCLNPFRARVLPGPEVMIADSGNAFDEAGHLKDPRSVAGLEELMAALRAEALRQG